MPKPFILRFGFINMKNIIFITLLIICIFSCKAQQPVVPLNIENEYGHTNGAYYKDVNNDFNKLIGTWKYTNGNEVFEVVFKKIYQRSVIVNIPSPISFYEDILIGDYRYVDSNGVELINTLSGIDNSSLTIFEHLIYGNSFVPKYYPPACDAWSENEKRIELSFKDPERAYLMSVVLVRHIISPFVDENGDPIETIELELTDSQTVMLPEADSPTVNRVPYGKYTLIKQ